MGIRSWLVAASGAVLLGALVGADVSPAATVGAARPWTVAAAMGLDAPGVVRDLDRRRAAAVAWHTARCMAGRGFVHIAVVEPDPEIPDGDLDPVSWAERWGFGISTAVLLPARPTTTDRNLVRISAMAPEARRAALQALLGDDRVVGCAATAGRTVHGLRDRELAPLRSEFAALAAAIEDAAETRVALDRWRACVGTDTDRRDYLASLLDSFRRRAEGLQARPSAMAALQAEERTAAATVARCESAYGAARARVRERMEATFADRHRATLSAIGARIRRVESAYPDLPRSSP